MNKYEILKEEIQKEYDTFPIGFAFSEKQFKEQMEKLNVTSEDELISIGVGGGFIRKADKEKFIEMVNRNDEKLKKAIENDKIGDDFIKDMFLYELANHEYAYTYDLTDTLDALNLTEEDLKKDKRLQRGLDLALEIYLSKEI